MKQWVLCGWAMWLTMNMLKIQKSIWIAVIYSRIYATLFGSWHFWSYVIKCFKVMCMPSRAYPSAPMLRAWQHIAYFISHNPKIFECDLQNPTTTGCHNMVYNNGQYRFTYKQQVAYHHISQVYMDNYVHKHNIVMY